jgi:hypothetical protein
MFRSPRSYTEATSSERHSPAGSKALDPVDAGDDEGHLGEPRGGLWFDSCSEIVTEKDRREPGSAWWAAVAGAWIRSGR